MTSPGKRSDARRTWWPWVIAYDLWNHAFLYNSLAGLTWYCLSTLLLACTIPAFTWAEGQWIWSSLFTLVFLDLHELLPEGLGSSLGHLHARGACAAAGARGNVACSPAGCTRSWCTSATRSRSVLYCELDVFHSMRALH